MFFQEVLNIVKGCFCTRQAVLDSTELAQPFSGLRERHAHMPTSSLSAATSERGDGPEGHQVARRMIECLRRQWSRLICRRRLRFSLVEAARGLDERIETAPIRPRSNMTICG